MKPSTRALTHRPQNGRVPAKASHGRKPPERGEPPLLTVGEGQIARVRTSSHPSGLRLLNCRSGISLHGLDGVLGAEVGARYFCDGDAATQRAGRSGWMSQGVFHSCPECG